MKILLVSELFNPNMSIGAVRTYNLALELSRLGHTVVCFASINEKDETIENNEKIKVQYVRDGKFGKLRQKYELKRASRKRKQNSKNESRIIKKQTLMPVWLSKLLLEVWYMISEYERFIEFKHLCDCIIDKEGIEYALTSYGPISNLWVGFYIKKKFPNIPWISDMRDPVDSSSRPFFGRVYGNLLQKKMLYYADKVVTVCDGLTNRYKNMVPSELQNKISTVTNGYQEEPILFTPQQDGIFRIGYTGMLYRNMSDMSELFRCLEQLLNENSKKYCFEIHYAGPDGDKLIEQARKYHVEKFVFCHGILTKYDSLRLQEKCDILCVLTWNTKKEQGILTGKFFEYLRLKKPILAIVTGDLKDAEISQRISDLRIGFSYECIKKDTDFDKMKTWLKTCIDMKHNLKSIDENINEDLVNEYSYRNITKRYEKIISDTIQ